MERDRINPIISRDYTLPRTSLLLWKPRSLFPPQGNWLLWILRELNWSQQLKLLLILTFPHAGGGWVHALQIIMPLVVLLEKKVVMTQIKAQQRMCSSDKEKSTLWFSNHRHWYWEHTYTRQNEHETVSIRGHIRMEVWAKIRLGCLKKTLVIVRPGHPSEFPVKAYKKKMSASNMAMMENANGWYFVSCGLQSVQYKGLLLISPAWWTRYSDGRQRSLGVPVGSGARSGIKNSL